MKDFLLNKNSRMHKRNWLAGLTVAGFLLGSSISALAQSDRIYTPNGSAPEGFAIGAGGAMAYNGSLDGSVYKVNLVTGEGAYLVPVKDPDIANGACILLGLRVDPRTNYLFAAGCGSGKAYVYDADNGALVMEFQLAEPDVSIINDLAITEDAVYFTDSAQPYLYRLPLSGNGELPPDSDSVTKILLPEEFAIDPAVFCCGANGIAATPDGETLIIGHSNLATLYRVDLNTNAVDPVVVDPPLPTNAFLDGFAMRGPLLYIMTPNGPPPIDHIQRVKLAPDLLSGRRALALTDEANLDGVASGAILGDYLYVNNARYSQFPGPETEYWITRVAR